VAAVSGVDHKDAGLASGIFNTVSQVGAALGLAILTTISTTKTSHALHAGARTAVALNKGFSDAVLVASGLTVASLLVVIAVLSNRQNRAFVEMVRSGAAGLEDVADAVAEAEGIAGLAGPGFEAELSALEAETTNDHRDHNEPHRVA
jgi:hypothetical protein